VLFCVVGGCCVFLPGKPEPLATSLPIVVPLPPPNVFPVAPSNPVMTAIAMMNAATLVPMINGQRSFRSFDVGSSPAPGASVPGLGNRTVGCSLKFRATRSCRLPGTVSALANSLARCAAARVRRMERRYNSAPTVVTTLATPAPSTVPATPSVEPSSAAVTAARAAAATCAIRMPDFSACSAEVSLFSLLMIPNC
jgi:hypothetical protein